MPSIRPNVDPRRYLWFMKQYYAVHSANSMRLPPEWVTRYGDLIPEQCYLEPPNGGRWPVQMKEIPCGMYFENGWSDFVYRAHLSNGDTLNLIHVGGGVFHFDRYNFMSGCIPTRDLERGGIGEESDPEADIDWTDDWFLSDQEDDDSIEGSDPEIEISTGVPLPTFSVTITRTLTENNLTTPTEFWAAHIRKDGHQFSSSFTVQHRTLDMVVTKQNYRYYVHGGWFRFKRDNDITVGVRCVF